MERSDNGHRSIDGYILIQASSENQVSELAERIARTPGVIKVERVEGPYDVIAATRETTDDVRISPAARAIGELDGILRAIPLAIASRAIASEESDGEAA